jgi:hypothetical protein
MKAAFHVNEKDIFDMGLQYTMVREFEGVFSASTSMFQIEAKTVFELVRNI